MQDSPELKPEHFDALVGREIAIAGSAFSFLLESVERLKSPSPRAEPFTLSLLAPPGTAGTQGMYHLQHPQLGELAVFLVPLGPKDGRIQFEAVFN